MASTSAMSLVTPLNQTRSSPFLKPLLLALTRIFAVAAALTALMMISKMAEAAGSGISPSLKNFLHSIAFGSRVLTFINGVIVGVSNFDLV